MEFERVFLTAQKSSEITDRGASNSVIPRAGPSFLASLGGSAGGLERDADLPYSGVEFLVRTDEVGVHHGQEVVHLAAAPIKIGTGVFLATFGSFSAVSAPMFASEYYFWQLRNSRAAEPVSCKIQSATDCDVAREQARTPGGPVEDLPQVEMSDSLG